MGFHHISNKWGKLYNHAKGVPGGRTLLSLAIDFSTLADGALPARLQGATWAISSGKAYNTPTGTSKISNGGFETWTTPTNAANWAENLSGTSTINQESSVVQEGSYSARFDIDASNNLAYMTQAMGIAVGKWAHTEVYVRASAAGKTLKFDHNDQLNHTRSLNPGDAWFDAHLSSLITTINGQVRLLSVSAASASVYFDHLITTELLTSSLLASYDTKRTDYTIKAAWEITTGTMAGVAFVDDPTSPTNYIAGFVAQGTFYLVKLIGTTITTVASVGVTYAAGATVEVRKSGTTYQLFYNGVQVGIDYTIADASLISNRYACAFSTYSGNLLRRFFAGVGPDVVVVPAGADLDTYIEYVSSGDILSLSGDYTLGAAASGFTALRNGTSARRTTVRGNGGTITGGVNGFSLATKQFIDVQSLSFVDQTQCGILMQACDDMRFTDVSTRSTASPTFIDSWKIRNCDRVEITGGTTGPSTGTTSCDGVEFWGPCNHCTVTNHVSTGFNNGTGDNDGHAYEVYGESAGEICDNIQFINCTAALSRAGISIEGGPSSNANHTNIVADGCTGVDNIVAMYRLVEGATNFVVRNAQGQATTQGPVTVE